MRALLVVSVLSLVACKASGSDPGSRSGSGSGSVSGTAPTPAPTPPKPAVSFSGPHAEILGLLYAGADCDNPKSRLRIWCIPATGWSDATTAPLPPGPILVGLTLQIDPGEPIADALTKKVTLGVLALRRDGGQPVAKITGVSPSNSEQATMVLQAVANVMAVFKGAPEPAVIPAGLVTYFDTLPAKAVYQLQPAPTGWTWTTAASSAELRRVGDFWVAIAVPTGNRGHWISIFTDRTVTETSN